MRVLIIDSHNANIKENPINLHLRNSLILQKVFDADLVTLPKHLEDKEYDKVIFVHAAAYSKSKHFVRYLKDQDVDYYYIVNEYNLGEPHALWALCRDYGRRFHVIANHDGKASKVVKKNVLTWSIVNLNTLIYDKRMPRINLPFNMMEDILYYGAFRKGRLPYFEKYFDESFIVSTSKRNIKKFEDNDIKAKWKDNLKWHRVDDTLYEYRSTLYIEDTKTHDYYNYLANRFYESLTYRIPCFFDSTCKNTIKLSGYPIKNFFIVESREELDEKVNRLRKWDPKQLERVYLSQLRDIAEKERSETIKQIKEIVNGKEG